MLNAIIFNFIALFVIYNFDMLFSMQLCTFDLKVLLFLLGWQATN